MFEQIDGVLAGRPYLLGDAISAVDVYLFMLARWTRNMTRKARDRPHVGPYLARIMARPAVQEAYAVEGTAEPVLLSREPRPASGVRRTRCVPPCPR